MATIADLFAQAVRHHQSGELAQAEPFYRQVIQADPTHPGAYHLLGILAHQIGNLQVAGELIRQAIVLNPNAAIYHFHLGMVYKDLGKMIDAANCFGQAVRLDPNLADAQNELGIVHFERGEIDQAVHCFHQALRINPNHPDAYSNLGNVLKEQGNLAESIACYNQELRINPGHNLAIWNRGLARLLQGDYAGGWPDYEQRWAKPGMVRRSFGQPRWDGSPLQGKTILVYADQGLGDTIQFLRFLPLVKERGGRVLLECPKALLGLAASMAGVDQLLPMGETLPPFDLQIPLMSLAGLVGTTLASIPAKIPYLAVDPKLIQHWRQELRRLISFRGEPAATAAAAGSWLNIGIVWQGNPTQRDDRHRSVPLMQFAPLAKIPGVRLLSLQVGPGREQLAQAAFPITDLGSRFDPDSLDDLAAVLPNLDLVITVCTSVAHLGGALGVPVWVALRFVPYWVWLRDRSDSPWYPTLRLFRQSTPGAWGEVFERIALEIGKM